MKVLVGVIGTAFLSLTLGATALAYPQEQRDQQEENKEKPAKPAQEEKKTQPEKSAKPEQKNAQQEKNSNEHKNVRAQHAQEAKPGKQDAHAQASGKGRIPADRYKANFGQAHRFHVSQSDYTNRRFQYGGYWFGFQGAWPSNWLYTQDVYVVEINGVYYLCNANYPGVNVALNVTL